MPRVNPAAVAAVSELLEDYRDDLTAFWDTLDGETGVLDAIDALIERVQDDQGLIAALRGRIADLDARLKRIEDRQARCRTALLHLLAAAGQRRVERPAATVSVRVGRTSVHVYDREAIPTQLCRVKTIVEPDKEAIRRQLEAGVEVPGAELARGDDYVVLT